MIEESPENDVWNDLSRVIPLFDSRKLYLILSDFTTGVIKYEDGFASRLLTDRLYPSYNKRAASDCPQKWLFSKTDVQRGFAVVLQAHIEAGWICLNPGLSGIGEGIIHR